MCLGEHFYALFRAIVARALSSPAVFTTLPGLGVMNASGADILFVYHAMVYNTVSFVCIFDSLKGKIRRWKLVNAYTQEIPSARRLCECVRQPLPLFGRANLTRFFPAKTTLASFQGAVAVTVKILF